MGIPSDVSLESFATPSTPAPDAAVETATDVPAPAEGTV